MLKIVSVLSLLLSFSAFSQPAEDTKTGTVTGTVYFKNGNPVAEASVFTEKPIKHAYTNDKGFFTLENLPYGNYTIAIKYYGKEIEKITIKLDKQNTQIKHTLSYNETNELNEVLVNGKTKETEIETQGFAVNVIKTEEASIRNIQTNELLNTTVGVKIRQNGGLGSDVQYSLNGLSGRSVSIFIDGIPIRIYGSSFNLNSIPPSMIKNIEVYKGVVPGHLSTDAVGGAINIVLKKNATNNLNASASYGSFNTFQTNINGAYRIDNSGFTVKASAFHNYSDNDYKISGRTIVDIAPPNGVQTPITARRFNDAYRSTGAMAQAGFTNVKWADQFLVGVTVSDEYKEVQHGTFVTVSPYKGRFLESDALLGNITYQKKDFFIKGLDVNINGVYGKRNRTINDTVAKAYTWPVKD